MGWCSGSLVIEGMAKTLKEEKVKFRARKNLYLMMIPILEDMDWDCQMDCVGDDEAFEEALRELHPDYFEDDE